MNLLATLALLFLTGSPLDRPDTIRISLFTLFKPETLQVRIASGDIAVLDAAGLASNRTIARGELIRIRLSGNHLNVVVGNSPAVIKQSAITDMVRIVPYDSATLELILPGKI